MNAAKSKLKLLIKSTAKTIIYNLYYYFYRSKKFQNEKYDAYAIISFERQVLLSDRGRYLFILYKYLEYAGYKVVIKTDRSFFLKLDRYSKLLLQRGIVFLDSAEIPTNTIVLKRASFEKTLFFYFGYSLNIEEANFVAPYPVHPHQLKYVFDKSFFSLPEPRLLKVFFSGNTDVKLYSGRSLHRNFKCHSRVELLNYLVEVVDKSCLKRIRNRKELNEIFDNDKYLNIVVINEAKTSPDQWLTAISKADFFLCPPGIEMPWCHNSIEAMSVGAIPILEYRHLFFPALEHQKNCLSFDSLEGLKECIDQALNMNQAQIMSLRKNVLEYYEKYLSAKQVAKKLSEFPSQNADHLKIGIPYIN